MKIPFNDLQRASTRDHEKLIQAADRVIRRGWFVLGPEVQAFEDEFADYCGGGRTCVSVANGSDALAIALAAAGVKDGTNVATCANAGMYSTTAILSLGARPVFIDIDSTSTMCPDHFAEVAAEHKLKAVVVTHLYGQLAEMDPILEIAKRFSVTVLEDCAQAHGAVRNGQKAGTFGDLATFSFYPTKNLGALGDGGAVLCRNAALTNSVRTLRQYGWSKKYCVETSGGRNSRLDEMQAAFLRVRLPTLDGLNNRRRDIATAYIRGLRHELIGLPLTPNNSSVSHLFVITCKRRDELRSVLMAAQIGNEIHYPIPDHHQPVLADQFKDLSLPSTEAAARQILSLPCFPELTDAEVNFTVDTLNTWNP
jgi:aminotransferase EvaB